MPLAALLVTCLLATPVSVMAAAPAGCARLCGQWVLDTAHSDAPEAVLDAALTTYKEPRARRERGPQGDGPVGDVIADMERSIGPIFDRPHRDDLRAELLAVVTAPATLEFDQRGTEILIRAAARGERRLSVGNPHARVDAIGTARINSSWKSGALVVTERYDRKREYAETYTLQRDGSLLVTREVERPGLKTLRLRAIYQRG
ncbi:MAG: hypothetical protein ABW278_04590 [Steroidobacteraceae bacterium]